MKTGSETLKPVAPSLLARGLPTLLLCACSLFFAAAPTWGAPEREQVFHRGNGTEPQTLDPHRAEGVPASNILRDLYEGLTIEAPNGDVIPGTAESWEISEDGRSYLFKLRRDARWSNGDRVTAMDFVYGLRRSADPATASKYSLILAPIENAEAVIRGDMAPERLGVEAVDDHTLRIRLKAPTPYLLGLLNHSTTYPVHRGSLEAHGAQFSRPGNLVSNGAYRLAEWVVQSHITLERNPLYWDNGNTSIDRVVYHPIENQSTELKRYRAGELDYTTDIPDNQFRWIRENLSDQLHIGPYLGMYYYGFNLTRPPFKDNLKLRRALSMAIDREIITEKITGVGEIPSYSWVPKGINNYRSQELDYAGWGRKERIEEAQRLYREAGYSKERPLEVEIRYNTSENHKKIAIAIAAMWKQALGVRTTLVNEEWKVFLQNRKQKQVTQVFRAGWIGDYNDPYTFSELMHSEHGINDPGYANPRYDELVEQASVESDVERRRQLLEEAERTLLADHPVIPIYVYVTKHLVKPYVGGYVENILNHTYTKNLWIEEH